MPLRKVKLAPYLIFVFLCLLVLITYQVVFNGILVQFDHSLAEEIYKLRQPILTDIFYYFTMLGQWQFVVVLSLIFIILFWIKKRKLIIPYITVMAGSSLLAVIGKFIFHRARPDQLSQLYPETYLFIHSYPSIHAVYAVVLFGFLFYFSTDLVTNKSIRHIIQILFIISCLAIGFSRLYLGLHYFSDVLAGYLLGGIWLLIIICLFQEKKA